MSTLVNEIIPKPKTVLEFYEGHPERWMQGHPGSKTADGKSTDHNENAVCLCLGRAIGFVYYIPPQSGLSWEERFKDIDAVNKRLVTALAASENDTFIINFNDAEGRTFDEVVQICREARI